MMKMFHICSIKLAENNIKQQNWPSLSLKIPLNCLTACFFSSFMGMSCHLMKKIMGQVRLLSLDHTSGRHKRMRRRLSCHNTRMCCIFIAIISKKGGSKWKWKIYKMELSGISPNTKTAEPQGCRSVCRPQRELGFISAVLESSRPWETAQWSIQKPLDIWPPRQVSQSLSKLSLSLSLEGRVSGLPFSQQHPASHSNSCTLLELPCATTVF